LGVLVFGAFPLLSSGERCSYSHGQSAIRKRANQRRRLHYDVFGSGRGTSTLNLQSGLYLVPSGGAEGAPFQSFLLVGQRTHFAYQQSVGVALVGRISFASNPS